MIPFVRAFDFAYGRRDQVSPLIQRVIADNPGPFTFTGTGTYIVGRPDAGAEVAVIDPGPLDQAHLAALMAAVEGRRVSHVLVTHTHRDHAPLARSFAEAGAHCAWTAVTACLASVFETADRCGVATARVLRKS